MASSGGGGGGRIGSRFKVRREQHRAEAVALRGVFGCCECEAMV